MANLTCEESFRQVNDNNQNPLRDPGFWLSATEDPNAIGRERCLGPCEH